MSGVRRQLPGSTKLRHGEVAGASPLKGGECDRVSKADQTPFEFIHLLVFAIAFRVGMWAFGDRPRKR